MDTERIEAVSALLTQAEVAHGTYETTELNGIYDQDWPRWYATYAVEHGIGKLLGRDVTTDQLAQFLSGSFGDFQRADPKPDEPWPAYTARRLAAEV
ncbi:MAG TPA: hypothetical protein VFY18_11220 [Candidatus Limnocylindrales bacterium]|nr:hypothetical protein [Candidatus Limnocylindrales bacterium]